MCVCVCVAVCVSIVSVLVIVMVCVVSNAVLVNSPYNRVYVLIYYLRQLCLDYTSHPSACT